MPVLTPQQLEAFLHKAFPSNERASHFRVEEIAENFARVRLPYHERHLRPGGTMSGPSVMTLADTATYVVILAMIGLEPMAVTSNLNIHFLRKPAASDLVAEARLLRLGKRQAVAEVRIFSEGQEDPVAHATLSYALPAKPSAYRYGIAQTKTPGHRAGG